MTRIPFKRSLPFLAVSLALLAAPLAHANDLLTVFRDAQSNDATFASAKSTLQATREREPQAAAALGLTVNGTANLTANSSRTSFWNNPPAGFAANEGSWGSGGINLSASYPLYRPQNFETWEQAKLLVAQAEAVFGQAQQDLITRVSQAYFDVLVAQDTLTFTRAKKTAIAEQLAQAKRNFEVGTSTIVDTHEAQARFDLVVAEELAAENDLANKRTALQQITGKAAPEVLKTLKSDIRLPAPTPNEIGKWVDTAETGSFAVRANQLAQEIAKREIDKQRAAHRPTVDLVGSAGLNGQNRSASVTYGTATRSASIGVQVAIPIYTGGLIDSRVREALANRDKSGADLEAAKRAAAQATRQAFLGVNSGLSQVRAFEAAQVSSQSALDSNKLGYEVGVRINIDVLNAQQQLFQTRRDLARARYDAILNGLRLKSAAGSLGEGDVQAVNALLQ